MTCSEATLLPTIPFKILSSFKTKSASHACPNASWIIVPVNFESAITVNLPPTGDLAFNNSTASLAVFLLKLLALSVSAISYPPTPATELTEL